MCSAFWPTRTSSVRLSSETSRQSGGGTSAKLTYTLTEISVGFSRIGSTSHSRRASASYVTVSVR